LVGDDFQIPFYRMVDGASIHTESNYPAESGLSTSTTIGSAIAAGDFLSDNYYGELSPEDSGMAGPYDKVYLNDFAVGRLVETPDQISGVINTFLAQNGQLNSLPDPAKDRILVTGFDFLYDSAFQIKLDYKQGGFAEGLDLDCLLDKPEETGNTDPCHDKPFTSADLESQLFQPSPHTIAEINTHANHFAFAASSGARPLYCTVPSYDGTNCYTAGMDDNASDLKATLLYTSGCHSGLTVPPTDAHPLDLPEEMARKKVVAYIGNTGYGWGMQHGRGLTETLMENLTGQILNTGSISIGKAFANAKRDYYMGEKRWDVFDEKVVHELTLFGIPNYLIVTREEGFAPPPKDELPAPDGPDKGCADGICLVKKLTQAGSGLLPPGVTQLDLNFTFCEGDCTPCPTCTYTKITTGNGHSYYTLNHRSSGEVGDAIQPHFGYNSYLTGTNAHGILFTGGAYVSENPFSPVVAVPNTTNYMPTGEGPLPTSHAWTPGVRASFGTSGGTTYRAIGQVGYTNMLVHTGFYENSTESRFKDMQFTVLYSNATDTTPPAIQGAGPFHTLNGLTAAFSAPVTDASGVYRVLVVYHEPQFTWWKSLELSQPVPGGSWEGTLNLKGDISYYLEAVDTAGNVGILSDSGPDISPDGNTPYGSTWSGPRMFDITLQDDDHDNLPDVWEAQYACLGTQCGSPPHTSCDPDNDYLTAYQELIYGTNPCKGDSDGGGDNDGSEYTHARNPLNGTDDKHLTIQVTKNGNDYSIAWPGSQGDNAVISGYYFVYRSDTPFFDPDDKISPAPIPTGTTQYVDSNPPCSLCYYNVWNYALDTPPPNVMSVVPNQGPAAGGTAVNVFGQNFQSGAKVYFDTAQATNVIFVSSNMLTCTTPAHAAGSVTVKVQNPNGQEGTLVSGFTYQ